MTPKKIDIIAVSVVAILLFFIGLRLHCVKGNVSEEMYEKDGIRINKIQE